MQNVYDNKLFFKSYQTMRGEKINANNLIENPIIKSLLPDLNNKRILDLGCGDGNMAKYFIEKGASRVVAIDISKNMIEFAKKNNRDYKIDYRNLKMEDISEFVEKFDIVYSSLAFHYVKDFNKLLHDIYNLLNPNGMLIFSQESPLITSIIYSSKEQKNKIEINGKQYYLISDYSKEGERIKKWNNVNVTKYHRSFANIVNYLVDNNFQIEKMLDSYASEEIIELEEKYKKEFDRPMFVFVKAKKI